MDLTTREGITWLKRLAGNLQPTALCTQVYKCRATSALSKRQTCHTSPQHSLASEMQDPHLVEPSLMRTTCVHHTRSTALFCRPCNAF